MRAWFADTNGKCEQALRHKEHLDRQRGVPGAEDRGQRRRPRRRQGVQPCTAQRHHSLVRMVSLIMFSSWHRVAKWTAADALRTGMASGSCGAGGRTGRRT